MKSTAVRVLLAMVAFHAAAGAASVTASTEPPGTQADEAAGDEMAVPAPVEFTLCLRPGPEVVTGTETIE